MNMCARTDTETVAEPQDRQRQELLPLRMRRLRKRQQQESPSPDIPLDTLAVVTAQQKRLLEAFYARLDAVKSLSTVTVILKFTQPAHILMVAVVFLVSSSLMQLSSAKSTSPLTNLAYLASFSIHLGNQFWMTFVSGLALYFNLPRHDFGAVQKVLFPKYFSINGLLSLVTLISFTKLHHLTNMKNVEVIQLSAISICFLLELTIRLYVVPSVIHLITEKTELEVAAGVGQEVGHFNPGPLMACPYYKRLHLRFRQLHMLVAVGNIAAMACSSLHLYFLAHHWLCNTL